MVLHMRPLSVHIVDIVEQDPEKRQVDLAEVKRYGKTINAEVFEGSAASGAAIVDAFTKVCSDRCTATFSMLAVFEVVEGVSWVIAHVLALTIILQLVSTALQRQMGGAPKKEDKKPVDLKEKSSKSGCC